MGHKQRLRRRRVWERDEFVQLGKGGGKGGKRIEQKHRATKNKEKWNKCVYCFYFDFSSFDRRQTGKNTYVCLSVRLLAGTVQSTL